MTDQALDPGNADPEQWTGAPAGPDLIAELLDLGARALAILPERRPESDALTLPIVPRGAGESCSPVISAEMSEWIELGGANSGCVGNKAHETGYHRGANFVPASDYSRRRDPNGSDGPYANWNWSCAGDFSHGGDAARRKLHKIVLGQLMAGAFPMICEMICQPDAGKPVMYWARWEGVTSLREYTGSGHDLWSHISWYRSRADERPYLWRQAVALSAEDAVKVFNTDGALNNRPWRSDISTNPKIAAGTALVGTWDEVHAARTELAAIKAGQAAMQATLAAVLAAAKNGDDDAAIIAAVRTETAALKADFARQLEAQAAAELERDTQNMTELLSRVASGGAGGVTPDALLSALRQVYGRAFATAVEANAAALGDEAVARALGR